MLENLAQLRCCDAYLRSAAASVAPRSSASSVASRKCNGPLCRVLIVEFRDEVFAGLRSLLEDYGCDVGRAAIGGAVADELNRFDPHLLLVNETMPDESGWLITCKLRVTKHRQPVWLYAPQWPRTHVNWREYCGVDEVIAYGGLLSRLVALLGERIQYWLGCSAAECRHVG